MATSRRDRAVLVADDEDDVRAVVREYLESVGLDVLEATNGLEALWAVKHERPRAIVLDLRMPRLGGFEAIRHLQRFDRSLRIVVLSAYLTPDLVESLRSFGVVALEKPPDLAALHQLLVDPTQDS